MKQRERETRDMVYQGRVRRRDKKKGRKKQPVCEGIRLDGPAQPCPGKPAGSRRFTAPAPDRCSLAVCDPESSMASRNPQAPPSKPDVQGRRGAAALGLAPWGAPASGGGNHFLPARQGVPWRWSWASAAQTGNPGGGRAEGPADTSWVSRKQPWPLPLDTGGPPPCPPQDVVALSIPA